MPDPTEKQVATSEDLLKLAYTVKQAEIYEPIANKVEVLAKRMAAIEQDTKLKAHIRTIAWQLQVEHPVSREASIAVFNALLSIFPHLASTEGL